MSQRQHISLLIINQRQTPLDTSPAFALTSFVSRRCPICPQASDWLSGETFRARRPSPPLCAPVYLAEEDRGNRTRCYINGSSPHPSKSEASADGVIGCSSRLTAYWFGVIESALRGKEEVPEQSPLFISLCAARKNNNSDTNLQALHLLSESAHATKLDKITAGTRRPKPSGGG